ncbi:hypothetical protein Zm00014a_039267 [Zea mays]|nr:Ycf20-like protein [Zea mays]XP_008681048.1 ycf20-like protein isoform X1 [Zea mays]XP_008681049.1 ycf20-like protein isoform X1 [Zea mays]ACF79434.1 unknown [Zea mays]ACF81687.1 unknown [Zea mays]ACG46659.1 hypothetical protein [Zea mays]AQK62517.1 Ycf20-like protein [Zea mays]AQK62520.1 Ycf20-like protein [Zea mays]|eukprot:NP_001131010.1 Ycf20-like protein [Zea mays]
MGSLSAPPVLSPLVSGLIFSSDRVLKSRGLTTSSVMKSCRLSELSNAEVSSLKARPRIDSSSMSIFGTVNPIVEGVCVRGDAADKQYQVKNCRWRPTFALETDGPSNTDGQDFDEDSGFLGRTRLGRLIQAAARELLDKLNSARTNSPTKIFLVLLGFYTANALATILGQTGDWDVLVAGVVVAAIEGIGMLMYRKPIARPPGRFQSLISMVNYWKAGVCLGLFVDAFKLGS